MQKKHFWKKIGKAVADFTNPGEFIRHISRVQSNHKAESVMMNLIEERGTSNNNKTMHKNVRCERQTINFLRYDLSIKIS